MDKNKQLMLARGSKTGAYDADSPDQWKFDLRHGEAEVKGMAWIKSKTIALGHESPFCVDEQGNPLNAEHMALECGWKRHTAANMLGKFEREGRVRLEKGKRIWYCAEVPQAFAPPSAAAPEPKTNAFVQRRCPTYVVEFIETLPRPSRYAAETKLRRLFTWKDEFLADGIAKLRSITERIEDTTYLGIGVPKKRLRKRRPQESKWVQLDLIREPDFVQTSGDQSVQTEESTSYNLETDLVQSENGAASLVCSTTASTSTTTDLPAAASQNDVVVVFENLQGHGTTTLKAAAKLFEKCRENFPDVTAGEIVEVIGQVAHGFGRNTRNRVGVLLSVVPEHFNGYTRPSAAPDKEEERQREFAEVLLHPEQFDEETVRYATENRSAATCA